ncbi:MAG: hypothetical protein QOJ16_776 [Acidobacteriota bacterium]|nr:hypothetical protein [Acidobacteriota bacterium]
MRAMKISKYLHSCLLFEHEGEKLLFDPGKYSSIEGRVKPETFADVATVVLTHDHPDHLYMESLKPILAKSGAAVIANGEVAAKLRKEGIEAIVLDEGTRQAGPFVLRAIAAQHEPILSDTLPRNTAFLVNERVLNPGDSLAPSLAEWKGVELLILPVMAPFLTEVGVAAFARQMEPRRILPVHDGYAKEFFLEQRYLNYGAYFEKLRVQFHPLTEPGASIEL